MSERGILLVNLGSPKSTQVSDVRRYLNQFLMDPYVIDIPWPLRRLLVGLILLTRPKASAHAYASIWWEDGSPLVVISRRVQQALQARLDMPVELAMRYGEPSIEQGLLKLAATPGVKEVLFMPQYPQFADSTITTSIVEAKRVIAAHGLQIKLNVLPPFYDRPEYLDALAQRTQPHLQQGFDFLLLSYHGLPERHLRKADPTGSHCLATPDCCSRPSPAHASCYRAQCTSVSRALAERLGLRDDQWSQSFQSRLGRDKWIEPYTEARIDELAAQGVKRLLVACPAFVTDCIETLEEIGDRAREQFIAAGGEELVLVPCLNDDAQWLDVLQGWSENTPAMA
ncbi:ferrochelatase [Pseudomonas sp. 5Ae-yellow]|uniref:ferrochelatase n=1 Tax=Pseudomonas sp. 5Ae-yellow TaxID=2759848 RepID=UPI0015F73382|nr:ferrochelatase [Pseudomonas sp. 5Ae-yellow]MBA6420497.1 ferrochelatase [Pseudomonas sp. 5Ae-yellow]|tara:strand:+ start:4961 stop:5983 length:1023 start_codon:yes stop_codon:yes gene_type:complete